MLSYMRRNAGSWMIKVLLVGVALSFVIGFGVLPTLRDKGGEGSIVAKVGDRVITRGDWNLAYENLRRMYQKIYPDQFSEEMLKQLRLRETALDNLINQALQLEEAKLLNLKVTDQELQEKIMSLPYFQRNGVFEKELYLSLLNRNRLTPGAFEDMQREEILIQKVQELIRSSVKLSDQELWDQYGLEKEEVDLTVLKVNPNDFEDDVPVDDEKLKDYFQTHSKDFLTQEQVKVTYAKISPDRFKDQIKVYTGDLEDYYDSHFEEFTRPEELRLRHILLRVSPDAEPALLEEKKKILNGLRDRIEKGEDFTQLAKVYSEDVSAEKGGDLGSIKKGQLVPEVERAAFSLKPGEVSDIVSSPFGVHLLKVDEYRASHVDPLEEVKETIRERLTEEKSWKLARRKAEEIIWDAKEGASLGKGKEEEGSEVIVEETDFFSRGESLPGLEMEDAFQAAAFGLTEGALSQAVKGKNAYYVLRMLERKAPEVPPYEAVKERLEKRYRREQSLDLARVKAEQVVKELNQGASLEDLQVKEGFELVDTGPFSRLRTYIPKVGSSPELVEHAFSLTKANPQSEKPYKINDTFVVVRLKERTSPERQDFLAEKDAYRKKQVQRKAQEIFQQWLSDLRTKHKPEVSPLS